MTTTHRGTDPAAGPEAETRAGSPAGTGAVPGDRSSVDRGGRWLAVLGLGYPLLTVAAFVLFPAPPGGDVSAAHDPAWLSGHRASVVAQLVVRSLAALGFLALGCAAAAKLRPPSQRVVVGAATASATLLLLAQTAVLQAVTAIGHLPDSAIAPSDTWNAAFLDSSSLPAVLVFGVVGVGLLRRGEGWAGRGLGALSLLGVPLGLIDALSYAGGPLAWFGLVGLGYFLLWSLLIATFLVRRPGPVRG